MKTSLETDRLFFRELIPSDAANIFLLDSDPEVHLLLGNKPARSIDESRNYITNVMQQYIENGIGRWAGFTKDTHEFIGWAGLKIEKNVNGHHRFYDLGYRLRPQFWGRGYATEAAKAFIAFGFDTLHLPVICAYAPANHHASRAVLENSGMQYVNTFEYDGAEEVWYELTRDRFEKLDTSFQ